MHLHLNKMLNIFGSPMRGNYEQRLLAASETLCCVIFKSGLLFDGTFISNVNNTTLLSAGGKV